MTDKLRLTSEEMTQAIQKNVGCPHLGRDWRCGHSGAERRFLANRRCILLTSDIRIAGCTVLRDLKHPRDGQGRYIKINTNTETEVRQ